jgi:hypothetical protein
MSTIRNKAQSRFIFGFVMAVIAFFLSYSPITNYLIPSDCIRNALTGPKPSWWPEYLSYPPTSLPMPTMNFDCQSYLFRQVFLPYVELGFSLFTIAVGAGQVWMSVFDWFRRHESPA